MNTERVIFLLQKLSFAKNANSLRKQFGSILAESLHTAQNCEQCIVKFPGNEQITFGSFCIFELETIDAKRKTEIEIKLGMARDIIVNQCRRVLNMQTIQHVICTNKDGTTDRSAVPPLHRKIQIGNDGRVMSHQAANLDLEKKKNRSK